ncbi:LptM family lipoprotein [Lederbergia lenta]|uniref:DUF4367 domain-containing protein n=1 Tax=Lederbergia lenta TaxID=1467 RepID=A0A2X4VQ45_LEDLE|nr:hypothetical protein [Lederbergia lenta]MEC2325557.1 hypothetical protein [Lederbergia lenta]SQI54317.1 Uncharacterised protein [Lederbergia lenta]
MKKITLCLMMAFTAIFIAACGQSFEEEKVKAENRAEQAFLNISPINETLDEVEFHLPTGLVVKNEEPNNVILEKGSHSYILFYNPFENMDSEALYKTEKSNEENILVDRTFKKDNRLGYLIIMDDGDGLYEITTGVGGVKVTTESELKDLSKDAELLMKIASSTKINE